MPAQPDARPSPVRPGPRLAVDVVMGGPGGEAAVSRASGAALVAALDRLGHAPAGIDIADRLDLARLRPGSVVFDIVHGTYGEDGTLQAELAAAGWAFVGSDAAASRLCMDKQATKARLAEAGIATPWGMALDLRAPLDLRSLRLPSHAGLVLKPRQDGSSVGLRLIANPSFLLPAIEDILRERGPVPYLLEERLPGPEYTVAVLDDAAGARALPPIRIVPAAGPYDYQAKYQRDDTAYELVAAGALRDRLGELAVQVHRACGCRDLSRCDLMAAADGSLRVLEVNTLPGFTDHSLTPKAAQAAGMTIDDLVEHLVQRAAARRLPGAPA